MELQHAGKDQGFRKDHSKKCRLGCVSRAAACLQGNQSLALPHISVPDISWIDWAALEAAGFKACVFDKDNTLCEPFALAVPPQLLPSFQRCQDAFGAGRLVLYSNSAGRE
jgi:phosphatidylglycerophosphatase GEP4